MGILENCQHANELPWHHLYSSLFQLCAHQTWLIQILLLSMTMKECCHPHRLLMWPMISAWSGPIGAVRGTMEERLFMLVDMASSFITGVMNTTVLSPRSLIFWQINKSPAHRNAMTKWKSRGPEALLKQGGHWRNKRPTHIKIHLDGMDVDLPNTEEK